MNHFSLDKLGLLLFVGVGGAYGAIIASGSAPIFFLMGALTLVNQSIVSAAFWQAFSGCVFFGMGTGFLAGLVELSNSKS